MIPDQIRGLELSHAGFFHGDLKPANIIIARDGIPKIADFGVPSYRFSRE